MEVGPRKKKFTTELLFTLDLPVSFTRHRGVPTPLSFGVHPLETKCENSTCLRKRLLVFRVPKCTVGSCDMPSLLRRPGLRRGANCAGAESVLVKYVGAL